MSAPRRGTIVARTVAVSGRPVACLEAGRGQALLLVHGAGGGGAVWSRQLDGLADVARVIAVDLPGHGGTAGPGCVQIGDYAAWLIEFLDAVGLDRVVLGGHSMGGAIAQTVALHHADRLRGLILVGTGARLRVAPRLLELFGEGSPEAPRLVGSMAYAPRTSREQVVEAERALLGTPFSVTLGDFVACDRFDVMGELGALRMPTLVVVGREDRLTPPRYATFLASVIAGAVLVEVEDAGHFPQLEQPAALNAAVRSFLADWP